MWGVLGLVGVVLIGGLLGSALTSEGDVTNNPESKRAQDLIDERFPERDALDEVVIVRSDEVTVTTAAFRERVGTLAEELGGSDSVEEVSSYLDPGGEILVSQDATAWASSRLADPTRRAHARAHESPRPWPTSPRSPSSSTGRRPTPDA